MSNSCASFTAILEAFPSGHVSNREWRINSLSILVPKTKVWLLSILYSGRYGLPTQLLSQHNSVILGHPLNKSRTPAVCWALCWVPGQGTELDKQSPAFKGLTVWRGRSQTLNKYNYPIYYLVIFRMKCHKDTYKMAADSTYWIWTSDAKAKSLRAASDITQTVLCFSLLVGSFYFWKRNFQS